MSMADKWFEIVRKLVPLQLLDGQFHDADGYGGDLNSDRKPVDKLSEAHLISSVVRETHGDHNTEKRRHMLVVDIDKPAVLVPSSTEGHYHLLIDHEMEQDVYFDLLAAMARAGIVEQGYAQAASNRSVTSVRVPWQHKPGTHETNPERYLDGGKYYDRAVQGASIKGFL